MTLRQFIRRLAWYAERAWLPINARAIGFWHFLRGHKIKWYDDVDWWTGHLGFITCYDCPDTNDGQGGASLCIWGRQGRVRMRVAQWLCAKRGGHRDLKHPTQWRGRYDDAGEHLMEELVDEWYCGRCLADVPAPAVLGSP